MHSSPPPPEKPGWTETQTDKWTERGRSRGPGLTRIFWREKDGSGMGKSQREEEVCWGWIA